MVYQGRADTDAEHHTESDEAEIVMAGAIFACVWVVVRKLKELRRERTGRRDKDVRKKKGPDGVKRKACSWDGCQHCMAQGAALGDNICN